jgi:inhibitor of the pro-sigma K processing machinery
MGNIGTLIVVVALIAVLFAIIKAPFKLLFKLVLNTAVGFVALFLLNWVGSFAGIAVAVNWINALIIGVLGIPGVVLVLVLQFVVF